MRKFYPFSKTCVIDLCVDGSVDTTAGWVDLLLLSSGGPIGIFTDVYYSE